MFILKYKHESVSPTLNEFESTFPNDVVFEDIKTMQDSIRHNGSFRDIMFPIHVDDDLVETELRLLLALAKNGNINEINKRPNVDGVHTGPLTMTCIVDARTDDLHDVDTVFLTDINSRKQISALSNLASTYKSVYLVKSRISTPFDEKVYVLLVNRSKSESSSKLIYKLPDIMDFGTIIYSFMVYCMNLGRSMADENEFHVNYVKVQNIDLIVSNEYKFYLDGLTQYVEYVQKYVK